MRFVRLVLVMMSVTGLSACATIKDMMPFAQSTGTTPQTATISTPGLAIDRKPGFPPYAMMKGTMLIAPHGAKRTDYYYWMNEKNTEKVVRYLEEENRYADEAMAHTSDLRNTLRGELKPRLAARPGSPPFKENGYWYYERYAAGADYPVVARRKGAMTAPEEILVDGEQEGARHNQFSLGHYTSTLDGAIFAYTADYEGDRWHTLVMKDTRTGGTQSVKYVAPGFAMATDNKTIFYLKLESGTARAYRLMKHVIATDPKADRIVYEEKDSRFDLSLKKSKGGKLLLLTSNHTATSEVFYTDASKPDAKWVSIKPRAIGVTYDVDEVGGTLYINTNLDAPDRRIMTASLAQPGTWTEVVPGQRGAFIQDFEVASGVIVMEVWSSGTSQLRLHDMKSRETSIVASQGVASYASFSDTETFRGIRNMDSAASVVRYGVSSPVLPDMIMEIDVHTGAVREIQRYTVPGFAAGSYDAQLVYASASDGKQVPITIAYRKDKHQAGKSPAILLGYGSYGVGNKPVFNPALVSLMDRGFVVAYAHVRGGREMGDAWYQEGKLRAKKNSFSDFIAAAEHLSKKELADSKRIFAMGHSAGGLLVGAVANMKADLFKGIVATVPSVDLLSRMLDDALPRTTFQYDEWGNPADVGDYEYIQSYSPYDQVERRAYPAMLVTGSYNDGEVGYYGPAKWVAKIRRLKTDQNHLIFRVNMTAGHDGETGRMAAGEEAAMINAFLLDQAGLNPGNKDK